MTAASPAVPAEATDLRRLGLLAVVGAITGLSLGSSLVKLAGAPGSVVAFWRLAFGSVIWLAVLLATRTQLPWSAFRRIAPAGAMFGLNLLFFFSAVKATRVANAEFIGTLTPVVTVPLAALVLHERVRWRALPWGLPTLAGVALIVFNSPASGESRLTGDLLAICAVATWSTFMLMTKRVRRTVSTTQFMLSMSSVAAVVVLPFALSTGGIIDLSAKGWLMSVLLAVLTGTVSHGLLVWAQRHVDLSVIAMLQTGQPALAAFWAWLLLDEDVAGIQVVGMAVVLASLAAFTRATMRPVR